MELPLVVDTIIPKSIHHAPFFICRIAKELYDIGGTAAAVLRPAAAARFSLRRWFRAFGSLLTRGFSKRTRHHQATPHQTPFT
jgi:hypothetical protein